MEKLSFWSSLETVDRRCVPDVVWEFVPGQRPWYAKVYWSDNFVLTKGIQNRQASEEEQSCQEGT